MWHLVYIIVCFICIHVLTHIGLQPFGQELTCSQSRFLHKYSWYAKPMPAMLQLWRCLNPVAFVSGCFKLDTWWANKSARMRRLVNLQGHIIIWKDESLSLLFEKNGAPENYTQALRELGPHLVPPNSYLSIVDSIIRKATYMGHDSIDCGFANCLPNKHFERYLFSVGQRSSILRNRNVNWQKWISLNSHKESLIWREKYQY